MSKSLRLLRNQLKILCGETFRKSQFNYFGGKKTEKYVATDGNCAHALRA